VNVQLNPPALVELHDVLSFVVPKVIDTLADGAKPLPVRVTCVPMGPLVGFADMDGVLTPKVALAVFPYESVAVTVCDPADAGTVKVTWKAPEEVVEELELTVVLP